MATERYPLFVYYLKVTLKDSNPLIWRDILVPSDLTLEELHYVIQTVMGWGNSHLHQFIAEEVLYNNDMKSDNNDEYGLDTRDEKEHDRNEKKYTVSQILTKEQSSLIYEYDLGDSWTHKIELKKILPADTHAFQPRCIRGEKACPPEDCGGIWGYTDMLETLRNAKNSEKKDILERLGNDFNPDYFDVDEVNGLLRHLSL
jgi:hypothetical protein